MPHGVVLGTVYTVFFSGRIADGLTRLYIPILKGR